MKNNIIEGLFERFHEEFTKYPQTKIVLEDKVNDLNKYLSSVYKEETEVYFDTDLEENYSGEAFAQLRFYDTKDGEVTIDFYYDERSYGYCMCTPDMPGYNKLHNCCGHGCDWSAPAFRVEKSECVMGYRFDGDEADVWSRTESPEQIRKITKRKIEREKENLRHYETRAAEAQRVIDELEKSL